MRIYTQNCSKCLLNSKSAYCRPKDLKFANNLKIPKNGSVFEFVYLRKQYGSWYKWSNLISPLNIDEKAKVIKIHFQGTELFSTTPRKINSLILFFCFFLFFLTLSLFCPTTTKLFLLTAHFHLKDLTFKSV